jgi:hypothetical protein
MASRSDGPSFSRSLRCLVAGGIFIAVWLGYLATVGALSGFIAFFSSFGSNHALWGGIPQQWKLSDEPRATIEFILPVVLWLATVWRCVAMTGPR